MVHLGDPHTLPWDWRDKNVAAPSTPPPPLSFADCSGGWGGDNNRGPILLEQPLVQVHHRRKGRLFFLFLMKGVLFHIFYVADFFISIKILLKKNTFGLTFY